MTNLTPDTLTDECVIEVGMDHLPQYIESDKLADITGYLTPSLDNLDQNMLKYAEVDTRSTPCPRS